MSKLFWFLVFVFILAAAGLAYLYFYYEKPKQTEIQQGSVAVNLSIYATENNDYVVTGYKIYLNNLFYKQGITLNQGAALEEIPANNTVQIINFNINNQTYYTDEFDMLSINTETPVRVKLNLIKAGDINFSYFINQDMLYVNFSSSGIYKDLSFCNKWSVHFLTLRTNATEIEKPNGFQSYQHCYSAETLSNSATQIIFGMKYFGVLGKEDYINFIVFDEDCYLGSCKSHENDTDLGGKTYRFNINNFP